MLATATRDQLPSSAGILGTPSSALEHMTNHNFSYTGQFSLASHEEKPVAPVMRTGHGVPYLIPMGSSHSYLSDLENMVNAAMRDESLTRLLNLHRAFYDLSPLAFCKTVGLVDNFITHVKVKPKYMMCVAVACYYIVSKFDPRESRPTVESLVRLSRCGGTPEDLVRMVEIILTKLGSTAVTAIGASSATALDFLRAILHTGSKDPDYSDLPKSFIRQTEIALCNSSTAFYRPSTIALALLADYQHTLPPLGADEFESPAFRGLQSLNFSGLYLINNYCGSSWHEVDSCIRALFENGTFGSYSVSPVKAPIDSPIWVLSKRTMAKLTAQTPPVLNSILEFQQEEEDED